MDDATAKGEVDAITNDSFHPHPGTQPAGHLRLLASHLTYAPGNAALCAQLDRAIDEMLTVTPNLRPLLEQQAGRDRAPLFLTPEEKAYLAEHNHFTAFASPSRCPIPTLNEIPPYHAAKHDERFPSPGREHRESELRPGTRPALRPLRPGHARPVPLKQASRRARAQGVRPAGVRRLVPAEIRPRDEKARRCGGARALAES